jgi:fucose 4-O-acetylase-like acetyltransferase
MRLLRTESMTATAAPPTTARSHFFDNAKLILIAIVAIGHFVEPFAYTRTSTTLSALWFSIYLFHMPAFIFVSGMFAKGLVDKRPFQTTKWLRNVVLYVALVLAIFLDTRYLMGQKGFTLSFFRQGGLPWYLLAIVIYPIVMVALKQIRPVPLLAGSVVLALLAGLDNSINDTLALSRVIVYAPFYIAGYYLPIAATERFVRTTKIKYAALALSAVTIVVVFTQLHRLRPYMPLLSARRGYESAGVSDTTGLIARAIILVLAVPGHEVGSSAPA